MLEQDKKEQLFRRTTDRRDRKKVYERDNKHRRQEIRREIERDWNIWNGNIEGDEEGELIYIGAKSSTVIDYAIRNIDSKNRRIDKK